MSPPSTASAGTPCSPASRDALPDGLGLEPARGRHVPSWARLPEAYDTTALLPAGGPRTDVAYVPGAPFHAGDPDRSTLRLCFVTQTPEEIAEGLRRLGAGLRGEGTPRR
ncbi:hypothetical protein SGRIM128S_01579 [Streptomyces griseomycini]